MKKSIKQTPKSENAKIENTRPFSAKQKGYKEDVYNSEEQKTYEKSDIAKNTKRNTAGPKS